MDENVEFQFPLSAILDQAKDAWKEEGLLQLSATWKGRPRAAYLVELLAKKTELTPRLIELLGDKDGLIAAYALEVLKTMKNPIVGILPEALLNRREEITVHMDSFRWETELGAYAKEVQETWRKKLGANAEGTAE